MKECNNFICLFEFNLIDNIEIHCFPIRGRNRIGMTAKNLLMSMHFSSIEKQRPREQFTDARVAIC